eukprot:11064884-Alexandrium_andersonii.AAC.1
MEPPTRFYFELVQTRCGGAGGWSRQRQCWWSCWEALECAALHGRIIKLASTGPSQARQTSRDEA